MELIKTLSDGSIWILVLYHNDPSNNRFTSSNASNYDDGNNLMSKLHLLTTNNYINSSEYYEFLAELAVTSGGTVTSYRWKQTSAPASTTSVTGYTNVDNGNTKGLCLCRSNTYIAWTNSNSDWWCSCGCYTLYNGGMPGFGSTVVTTGFVRLWVRIDGTFEKICTASRLKTITLNAGYSFVDKSSPKNAAGSPNYCPIKSEISPDSSDYSPSATISGSYSNSQLVCEKSITFVSVGSVYTPLEYYDISANGSAASIKTAPAVTFVYNGQTKVITYPNTDSLGSWNIYVYGVSINSSNGVYTSSLSANIKPRSLVGYVNFLFTPNFASWTVNCETNIYLAKNEIIGFDEEIDLEFPYISYSAHTDETNYNSTWNMGADDVDPIYRRNPLRVKSFTSNITGIYFDSGYHITTLVGNYISRCAVINTSTNTAISSELGTQADLLNNGAVYNNFSYSCSNSSSYKLRTYSNLANNLDLYTSAGNASSNKTFTITATPSNLQTRVLIKEEYRLSGGVISQTTASMSKTFTQHNRGVITVTGTHAGDEYILYQKGVSANTIYVVANSSIGYGVIGTGNNSGTVEIENSDSMPIVKQSGSSWQPQVLSSSQTYIKLLILLPQQSGNSYRLASDPSPNVDDAPYLLKLDSVYGYSGNVCTWYPRADYDVDVSELT